MNKDKNYFKKNYKNIESGFIMKENNNFHNNKFIFLKTILKTTDKVYNQLIKRNNKNIEQLKEVKIYNGKNNNEKEKLINTIKDNNLENIINNKILNYIAGNIIKYNHISYQWINSGLNVNNYRNFNDILIKPLLNKIMKYDYHINFFIKNRYTNDYNIARYYYFIEISYFLVLINKLKNKIKIGYGLDNNNIKIIRGNFNKIKLNIVNMLLEEEYYSEINIVKNIKNNNFFFEIVYYEDIVFHIPININNIRSTYRKILAGGDKNKNKLNKFIRIIQDVGHGKSLSYLKK